MSKTFEFNGTITWVNPQEKAVYFGFRVSESRFERFRDEVFQCTVFPSRNQTLFQDFMAGRIKKNQTIQVTGHFEEKRGGGMHLIVHGQDRISAILSEIPDEEEMEMEMPDAF